MPTGTRSTMSSPDLTGALAPHATLPALGEEMLLVAEIDQRVQPVDRLGPDIAALAAVAAVRPAELDVLLAAKRHRAVAARAGPDVDLGEIEKFHGAGFRQIKKER